MPKYLSPNYTQSQNSYNGERQTRTGRWKEYSASCTEIYQYRKGPFGERIERIAEIYPIKNKT